MLAFQLGMPGTLYLVATPIGNLGDVSSRARVILSSVDLVLCEDTRVAGKLLHHLGIRNRFLSYHEHNERERTPGIIERLKQGEDIALVSDAGTPAISDPGYRLVRAAREASVPLRALPGASAVLAALVVSGLPASHFTFLGFLPSRGAARRDAIDALASEAHTVVLFESARRLPELLADLAERFGARAACVARELTKLHEEHRTGTLPELRDWSKSQPLKGEITLVLDAQPPAETSARQGSAITERFDLLLSVGLTRKEAMKVLARERGLTTRDVYDLLATKR